MDYVLRCHNDLGKPFLLIMENSSCLSSATFDCYYVDDIFYNKEIICHYSHTYNTMYLYSDNFSHNLSEQYNICLSIFKYCKKHNIKIVVRDVWATKET